MATVDSKTEALMAISRIEFTTQQASRLLDRSPATLLGYADLGLLKCRRVRDRHHWDAMSVLRLVLAKPPTKATDVRLKEAQMRLAKVDLTSPPPANEAAVST